MKSHPVLHSSRAPFLLAIADTYATFFFRQCNILRLNQCPSIIGAAWSFRSLKKDKWSDGGFMMPSVIDDVQMNSANGWSGNMSPEACGIALSMCSFSILSFAAQSNGHPQQMERLAKSFHQLRSAAYEGHKEATSIAAFCD